MFAKSVSQCGCVVEISFNELSISMNRLPVTLAEIVVHHNVMTVVD
jgi:hypothetical protein